MGESGEKFLAPGHDLKVWEVGSWTAAQRLFTRRRH